MGREQPQVVANVFFMLTINIGKTKLALGCLRSVWKRYFDFHTVSHRFHTVSHRFHTDLKAVA